MSLSPYLASGTLSGPTLNVWRSVTATHIQNSIASEEDAVEMMDLSVATNILGQQQLPRDGETRYLQEEEEEDALIIQFEVQLLFRSAAMDLELEKLVFSAWDTDDEMKSYIAALQGESNVFDSVTTLIVEVTGYVPVPAQKPEDGDDENDDLNIAVIAGASAGGAALLILVTLLLLRTRREKDGGGQEQDSPNNHNDRTQTNTASMQTSNASSKIAVST